MRRFHHNERQPLGVERSSMIIGREGDNADEPTAVWVAGKSFG
jgi:hypothetical protein